MKPTPVPTSKRRRSRFSMLLQVNRSIILSWEQAGNEGIFCGIWAGAAWAGALYVCRKSAPGSTILCLLPDTGERYQSTPLFDGIETEMNDEEIAILNSAASLPAISTGLTP